MDNEHGIKIFRLRSGEPGREPLAWIIARSFGEAEDLADGHPDARIARSAGREIGCLDLEPVLIAGGLLNG